MPSKKAVTLRKKKKKNIVLGVTLYLSYFLKIVRYSSTSSLDPRTMGVLW